jgi:DNA-binding NtrC family response regulator
LRENLPPKLLEYHFSVAGRDDRGTTTVALDLPPVPVTLPAEFSLEGRIEDYEKKYITCALEQAGGVKSQAAKLLGISFRSLRYRIAKYGIVDNDPTEDPAGVPVQDLLKAEDK